MENLQLIPPFPGDTGGLDVSPLFAQVLEDTEQLATGEADFGVDIDAVACTCSPAAARSTSDRSRRER